MYIIRLSAIFFKYDIKGSSLAEKIKSISLPAETREQRLDNSKRTWKTKRGRTGALRKRDCRKERKKENRRKSQGYIRVFHEFFPGPIHEVPEIM